MMLSITLAALEKELQSIGVHPASVSIFKERSAIEPVKIFKVRMPAANILKQEAISSGADCAVNVGCATGSVDYSDVILLGTRKQYRELLRKLQPMTFFGLPALAERLEAFLGRLAPRTALADGRELDYSRMAVMGIINLTEDSFYAPSRRQGLSAVLKTAEGMLADGADILDLGAESTRPGAQPVADADEEARLLPAVEALKKAFPQSIVSVDTYRTVTASAALDCGADMINDITAAADPGMAELIARSKAPIIAMHMQGEPRTMQVAPHYTDVVREVCEFLASRRDELLAAGVGEEKIILDPGIGFGKTVQQNLELMGRLGEIASLGQPVLLAASRKGTIGKVLGGLPGEERLYGTLALSCQAVVAGAHMVRVHDVRENTEAIRMLEAVRACL